MMHWGGHKVGKMVRRDGIDSKFETKEAVQERHVDCSWRDTPGRRDSKCKGAGAGMCFLCLRNQEG